MVAVQSTLGLCVNCDRLPTCGFARSNRSAVLYCEEFHVVGGGAQAAMESVCPDGHECPPSAVERGNGSPRAGLCFDCLAAGSCSLSRSEGGIWHCEEYR